MLRDLKKAPALNLQRAKDGEWLADLVYIGGQALTCNVDGLLQRPSPKN